MTILKLIEKEETEQFFIKGNVELIRSKNFDAIIEGAFGPGNVFDMPRFVLKECTSAEALFYGRFKILANFFSKDGSRLQMSPRKISIILDCAEATARKYMRVLAAKKLPSLKGDTLLKLERQVSEDGGDDSTLMIFTDVMLYIDQNTPRKR